MERNYSSKLQNNYFQIGDQRFLHSGVKTPTYSIFHLIPSFFWGCHFLSGDILIRNAEIIHSQLVIGDLFHHLLKKIQHILHLA